MTANETVTISLVKYNRAVQKARSAASKAGAAAWIIGDAALTVATEYGENKLKAFADDISVEIGTVRNYRTMAGKFPADDISRSLQSPTVYGIFTSQDDAFDLVTNGQLESRDANGEHGDPWTVSAARALVKARKDALKPAVIDDDDDDDDDESDNESAPADKRALLVAEIDRLKAEYDRAVAALAKFDAENAPAATVTELPGSPRRARKSRKAAA